MHDRLTKKDIHLREFIHDEQMIRATTQIIVALYILSLFCVISLFYLNKYYNMGVAKYYYFKCMSYALFPIIGILCILYCCNICKNVSVKSIVQSLSITDYFVLGYILIQFLSFLCSPYKDIALIGTLEWSMGLVSQLIFVAIYFVVSRFFEQKQWFLYFFLGISAIVFLLGILNRFGIDPLNMYDTEQVNRSFLSTIGQPSWYSSYMCSIFPLGLFLYWNSSKRKELLLYGLYCFISAATLVTQNSDSAYVSLVLVFLTLFCFSFRKKQRLFLWLQLLILTLAAFQFMGLLQMLFPNYAFRNDKLSVIASQHPAVRLLLGCVLILYVVLYVLDRADHFKLEKLRFIPYIVLALFITGLIATIILICCVTTGHVPESLSALRNNNYLMFNDNWGNQRGINWKYAVRLYLSSSPLAKIIGFGPDCYGMALYESYADQMNLFWGDFMEVNNAHNEWLNCLLTSGILGLISYAGIFISQISYCIKEAKNHSCVIGVLVCLVSYIGNNIFGYQQVVCTPIIFIVLGAGEYMRRQFTRQNAG